jgi:hypothetical protein
MSGRCTPDSCLYGLFVEQGNTGEGAGAVLARDAVSFTLSQQKRALIPLNR